MRKDKITIKSDKLVGMKRFRSDDDRLMTDEPEEDIIKQAEKTKKIFKTNKTVRNRKKL